MLDSRQRRLINELLIKPADTLHVYITTAFTHITASSATFVGQLIWIGSDRVAHYDSGTEIGAVQRREFPSLEDFVRWLDHKDNRKRFVHPIVQKQVDRFLLGEYPSP